MANDTNTSKNDARIGGAFILALIAGGLWWCSGDDHPTSTSSSAPIAIALPPTPEQQAARNRVFVESDFIWDKVALPAKYKDVVIPLVNRIHQQDDRCKESLDPTSVSLAGPESKPGAPVFYVTCGHFPTAANVYFRPEDLQGGTAFAAPTYYSDQSQARAMCRDYAKRNTMNPATVDFNWSAPIEQLPDGRTVVTIKFTAKNSFGVPARLAAECTFNATSMIDGRVYEITE